VPDVIRRLNTAQGLAMPVAEVAQRKEELYYEGLPQLKPVAEVLEHIEQQYGRIPFAVVSGSARESVQASLTALNLLDRFETLVCAGDYSKSKPDPEPFLIAAARLGWTRNRAWFLKMRSWACRPRPLRGWRRCGCRLRKNGWRYNSFDSWRHFYAQIGW